MGGEKSAVMWAGPAGENNPRPIGMRESVDITASLSKCRRVGGIYLRDLHVSHLVTVSSFSRVFNCILIVNNYF